jgi:tetratricopeptide (TPR) repeat protein
MRLLRSLPVLALTLAAGPLAAQGECPVDIYQPSTLTQAGLSIQKAMQAEKPADVTKALRDAMRFLQDEGRYRSNLVGGGFLKAQVYVLWLNQEGATDEMTLEALNARGADKTAKVDLARSADSLLKAVEAVSPSCVAETLQWRQSKPWTERLNKAYAFLGANDLDSATYYTDRSAILFPNSPFVHNAYAQIAQKRNDIPGMLGHLRAAIQTAEGDTSLTKTRQQLQFQLAAYAQREALTAAEPLKGQLMKEALDIYVGVIRDMPDTPDAAYSMQQAAEAIGAASDTAAAKELFTMLSADAASYTDLTLLIAADLARFFNQKESAIALYEGALAKNENIRDANYFLAFLYYETKKPDKIIPLADRLMKIDPSNGDNYQLKALAYQLQADAEKDAKKKADIIKTMQTLSNEGEAMPHRLTITRFERREEGAALSGVIENRARADKAYTVNVEFLDMQGAVVEAMTAQVAAVKPNETGSFELTATKPGIVAYRYAALK